MAATPSNMLPLGTPLPSFALPEPLTGNTFSDQNIPKNRVIVVMFICNHCPYVIHLADHISMLAYDYKESPVAFVAINSNDVENYPDDSPQKMALEAKTRGYIFPYLFDETQQVAKSFHAACTPDFFVFDKNRNLAYRGQFDSSRPSLAQPVTGSDLRDAITALIEDAAPSPDQKPSMGCNIKWKPGNQPT